MSPFPDRLALTPLPMQQGRRIWGLLSRFRFRSHVLGTEITVPAGFETDLASIPRAVQPLIQKDEGQLEAAVIHDFLYTAGARPTCTRRQADRVFLEAMTLAGVGPVKRGLMFHAVRAFGASGFRRGGRA